MSVRSYLLDAFYSLGAGVNKRSGDESRENAEGVIGARLPELTLDKKDEDLVKLADTWERTWNESDVKQKWEAAGEENEKYWKGEHYNRPTADKSRAMVDNAIFEGLETYLPQVTRRNPEPMVVLAVGEEADQAKQDFVHALQLELGEIADEVKLRLKLKGAARHQSVRLLGAVKLGWDLDNDRPAVKVVRPQKLILDPEAATDEDGYTGDRQGEHRRLPAWKIVALIEKDPTQKDNVEYITNELAKGDMATEIGFVEWWTVDYMFWKCGSRVLLKRKNPHWNYDEEPTSAVTGESEQGVPAEQPIQGPEATPELPQGAPAVPQIPQADAPAPQEPRKGVNHFKSRRMPYVLLSIFNLGKQPVDATSLMGQNLANQDLLNKRNKQIDRNADNANNGMVVSLERSGLTKDQASRVAEAIRKGGVVTIPSGTPQEAVYKPANSELPSYIYTQLVDTRQRVRDIWGTRGSSPAGIESETTVRGKIISRGLDTDRIGGGISEYLEQMADDIYNWIVQLLYVYDDRFQEQFAQGVVPPRVKVSVKEGSLLPKDSQTIANQAIELSGAGKMSLIDLYKRLDYPNPEQLAANVWLEVNAPEILFANDPRVQQVIQQKQQAATGAAKPPSTSISYKDLPPVGQVQLAEQAGIKLDAEGLAAHAGAKEAKKQEVPSNLPGAGEEPPI